MAEGNNYTPKSKRIDTRRGWYIMGAVACLCVYLVGKQVVSYANFSNETERAALRVEALQKQKEKLLAEREALGKIEYVEKVARDDYNMVKPNEVPVFVVDEKR